MPSSISLDFRRRPQRYTDGAPLQGIIRQNSGKPGQTRASIPRTGAKQRISLKLGLNGPRPTLADKTNEKDNNMDLQLKSKTALVSGASIGIGRAVAKGLAREGVRVVAVARRKDLLEELAQEVRSENGGTIIPVVQDIMQKEAAKALAAAAITELGHVDILVNNAGGSRPLPVDAPDSAWDEAIELNFTRYRQVTHALLPQMIKQGWGRIINVTGKSEPEGLNAAFAAKAAVHAWAKGLSREIGEHGITVNCIPPGRIMSEQIRRNYPDDYRKQFAEEEIPVGYWGEPEDLAALVVFLASPIARYITGAVIPVDGGLRRYQF
jgi:3-oxoacyl-[acyl-carrier protein] reductase